MKEISEGKNLRDPQQCKINYIINILLKILNVSSRTVKDDNAILLRVVPEAIISPGVDKLLILHRVHVQKIKPLADTRNICRNRRILLWPPFLP